MEGRMKVVMGIRGRRTLSRSCIRDAATAIGKCMRAERLFWVCYANDVGTVGSRENGRRS